MIPAGWRLRPPARNRLRWHGYWVHWTRRHRDPWPASPPGRLDDAAERLVRIALLDRLAAVPVAFAYLGLGPHAGQPPRSVSDAAGGIPRSQAELLRHRLRQVTSAAAPPPPLRPAVELIDSALPASPGRLAALLAEAGLTHGILHPLTVRALARLWDPQPSWTVTARTRSTGRILTGPTEQRTWLPLVADTVRTAGVLPLGTARTRLHDLGVRNREQATDLLEAWQLTHPGSPLAWDRMSPGRLLRPVQRTLAAA